MSNKSQGITNYWNKIRKIERILQDSGEEAAPRFAQQIYSSLSTTDRHQLGTRVSDRLRDSIIDAATSIGETQPTATNPATEEVPDTLYGASTFAKECGGIEEAIGALQRLSELQV